jgi:hypothetical protein
MKKSLIAGFMLLCMHYTHAQTKVFKEVSEDISSQIRTIRQDNALVGYVVFTTLEKASADSFNYKITIMDENLNDIGTINFKEKRLNLQAVSFEQDVLCLAYLKSNFIGAEFKGKKEYKEGRRNARSDIFIQFLGLDGKIIQSNNVEADVTHDYEATIYGNKYYGAGRLKHNIQLRNLQNKGFACFYGDETKNNLLIYNPAGKSIFKRPVKEEAQAYGLLTSHQNVYILCKKKHQMLEGGYVLLGFNDSTDFLKKNLTDKRGNSLKVLSFDNDPVTGNPYLSGYIIDPVKGNEYAFPKEVMKGTYAGVFSINVNGSNRSDINEVFTYWNDGSQSFLSKRGRILDNKHYVRYVESFKDYEGNTWFTGSSYKKGTKWGSVASTVITAPLIFVPAYISIFGYRKFRVEEPVLLKQNAKGAITLENPIEANKGKYVLGRLPFSSLETRSYYSVTNSETKTNYLIVDDKKDIFVYNVNKKKVVRTISHKDGSSQINVFPAKEGHVMVSEYNKKERYTRYSIESL